MRSAQQRYLTRLRAWLLDETPALPVDLFRSLVGLLTVGYFIRLLLETADFSSPDGLLDHAYLSRVLWFTRWSLFQPGMGTWVFYLAYGVGVVCGLGLVAGERCRLAAAVGFVIASSHYRWNFVVFSIDDAMMHLCLFWLVLLPAGRTLVLRDLLREGPGICRRWVAESVPGATVRCLLGNICLMYIVAGLCKLGSEYWRSGFALYAILRQPIAWSPDWWGPAALPWLTLATYLALATELSLPWLLTRPAGSRRKWLGLFLLLGFHLGITFTLRVAFANLALAASAVLFFGPELTRWIERRVSDGRWGDWTIGRLDEQEGMRLQSPNRQVAESPSLGWADRSAIALLGLLVLAMLRGVPVVGPVHHPAYAVLWTAGLAQDYHLFGWIDEINYHAASRARLTEAGETAPEIPATRLLPPGMRYTLLQTYLHQIPWMMFPRDRRGEFTALVVDRLRTRSCRREAWRGTLEITTTLTRITPEDPALRLTRDAPPIRIDCGGWADSRPITPPPTAPTSGPVSPRGGIAGPVSPAPHPL